MQNTFTHTYRQLAAALLDAAYDIETAPAAVLAAGHTETAAS